MKSDELQRTIDEIVPPMYESISRDFRYPKGYNLAASNQCHVLTRGLYLALQNRGITSRREFHQLADENVWHYVIAHDAKDPTQDDVITDLNPWQFKDMRASSANYLHGKREEVMSNLRASHAPEYFVSLRGLSTIIESHKEK